MSWLSGALLLVLVVPMNAFLFFGDSDNYAYRVADSQIHHYYYFFLYGKIANGQFLKLYKSEGSNVSDWNMLVEREDETFCTIGLHCYPKMKLLKKNETHFFAISYQSNVDGGYISSVCADAPTNHVFVIDIDPDDPDFRFTKNMHIWYKCGLFVPSDVDRVVVSSFWLYVPVVLWILAGVILIAIGTFVVFKIQKWRRSVRNDRVRNQENDNIVDVALVLWNQARAEAADDHPQLCRYRAILNRIRRDGLPPEWAWMRRLEHHLRVSEIVEELWILIRLAGRVPLEVPEDDNLDVPMVDLNDPPVADEAPIPNPENAGPEKNEEMEEPESGNADGPEEPLLRKNDDEKSPESL